MGKDNDSVKFKATKIILLGCKYGCKLVQRKIEFILKIMWKDILTRENLYIFL